MISQTFATIPGSFYDLSFWLFNQEDFSETNGFGNEFRVTFGSKIALDLVNSADFGYTQFTYTAQATGTSLEIEFAGRNPGTGIFALDGVSVTPALGHGVPETGSTACFTLLAAGSLLALRQAVRSAR